MCVCVGVLDVTSSCPTSASESQFCWPISVASRPLEHLCHVQPNEDHGIGGVQTYQFLFCFGSLSNMYRARNNFEKTTLGEAFGHAWKSRWAYKHL